MRTIIKHDGTEIALDRKHSIQELTKLIGAEKHGIDTVSLIDGKHVMLVDDIGLLLNLPINAKATAHYAEKCRGRNETAIHGDVAIVPDEDFV